MNPARGFLSGRIPEVLILVLLLVSFGEATYRRNALWRDDLLLWTDTAAKSPSKPRALYNLGVAAQERGDSRAAIGYYLRAIELRTDYVEAYTNLGETFLKEGEREKAIRYFRLALRFKPDHAIALFNLGVVYLEDGMVPQAEDAFEHVLRISPGFDQARMFLDYIAREGHSRDR